MTLRKFNCSESCKHNSEGPQSKELALIKSTNLIFFRSLMIRKTLPKKKIFLFLFLGLSNNKNFYFDSRRNCTFGLMRGCCIRSPSAQFQSARDPKQKKAVKWSVKVMLYNSFLYTSLRRDPIMSFQQQTVYNPLMVSWIQRSRSRVIQSFPFWLSYHHFSSSRPFTYYT